MNRNLSLQERLRLQREGGAAPARPPASPVAPATPPPTALPVQSAEQLGLNPYTPANRPQMMSLPQQPLPPSNISAMAPPAPARPQSRDPIQRARNEAIYGGELQEQIGMKPKRGFWDIVKTAGVGALQGMATGGGLGGAIGGALAGGITSAIDPATGRAYRFDVMQRPRMEADIARQMAYDKFGREQMRGQAELEQTMAQTEKTRAETEAIPGREELTREAARARIGRERAQTERLQRPTEPRRTPEEEKRAAEMHAARLGLIGAQTKRAQRPPSSGGGGGGARPASPEKPTSLPGPLIEMLNDAEELRLDAEAAWGRPEEDVVTKRPIAGSNTGEKLRQQYVQALNRIKQLFPDYVDVLPGVDTSGKPLPEWPYVERRR
jgi:hypothetical protein